MLKKFYKVSIVFSLLLLFVSIPVHAKVGQSTIPVTYNISEDSRYDLNINVSGDGTVYDGTKSIRNGKVVYQLKVGEEKAFKIIPDEGVTLKSISWRDGDIDLSRYYEIENISGGKKLSLKGISTDSELEIQFDSKDNTSENLDKDQNQNDSGIKDDVEKSPQTGDKVILGWILIFILSLGMMIVLRIVDFRKSESKS